ncbi:MAG TPA: class III extradiol ring-cleavage dioxygenase [Pantanalinema sp.]
MTSPTTRMPTLYIPHGGGPCFFMDPMPGAPADMWESMAAYLRGIASAVGVRPKAVLVISGHWEVERPTLNVAPKPELLYDYYGFPEHTYRLKYPAPGSPEVAARVRELLAASGIESGEDATRGLDHGVFVPFMLIYPEADVPIVQLSLQANLDAADHLAIGRALAPLRDEGVLIVGSGMSYHNLRAFFGEQPEANRLAEAFDDWLNDALGDPSRASRDAKLSSWHLAPGGRFSHPRPEHLIPLMVAAGAAGDDPASRTYNDRLFGKAVSGFQFG